MDVAIVDGQVDQPAPGIEDVVIVDRRQAIDRHLAQVHLRAEVKPRQQPITVQQQTLAVGRPVRRLEKQAISGVEPLRPSAANIGGPYL